jgi:hypothetical protein
VAIRTLWPQAKALRVRIEAVSFSEEAFVRQAVTAAKLLLTLKEATVNALVLSLY